MCKIGDKFIVEIGEKYNTAETDLTEEQDLAPEFLYRIKGFKTLIFDEKGLDRLKPFSEFDVKADILESAEKESYEKGLSDAWECAKKIYLDVDKGGLNIGELGSIFGKSNPLSVMQDFTPQEAIKKLKAWEEKQNIQVGDVVKYKDIGRFVVTKVYESGVLESLSLEDLSSCTLINENLIKKTGKHIDLTEIFKGLEGEDDKEKDNDRTV